MSPITKVEVDYETQPKNAFAFRVNEADIYCLVKEEVDFDPTKIEALQVHLCINDIVTIEKLMPWIMDDVDEKIQNALGTDQLGSLAIDGLDCKSWVANEFLDLLTCYDIPAQGLNKLSLEWFNSNCEPF